MRAARRALLAATLVFASCSAGPAPPASLDTRNDVCASCRMPVSDAGFAAQLVAWGEEPVFFDDLGCLRDSLAASPREELVTAYVADHRTRRWIPAAAAVYTRVPSLATPMSSHLIAHESAASRDADPEARGGEAVTAGALFGATLPGGAR